MLFCSKHCWTGSLCRESRCKLVRYCCVFVYKIFLRVSSQIELYLFYFWINFSDNSRVIRFKCTLQNTILDVLRSKGWTEVKEWVFNFAQPCIEGGNNLLRILCVWFNSGIIKLFLRKTLLKMWTFELVSTSFVSIWVKQKIKIIIIIRIFMKHLWII